MGNYRFSMAPNISVPRSKFKMPFNHITTFNHGKLVPIDAFEILPGDEFKCDFSSVIRMSTPIAPIFGNIMAHVHAYFVPMRLIWEHTKEFYGENKTSAGYQTNTYTIPSSVYDGNLDDEPDSASVSNYLGKPCVTADSGKIPISVLKERAYALIWSEYYRAQQLQQPFLLSIGDTGTVGSFKDGNSDVSDLSSHNFSWKTTCMNVCKEFDYFTACTTAPQYGASVTLPLGSTAPVISASSVHDMKGNVLFKQNLDSVTAGFAAFASSGVLSQSDASYGTAVLSPVTRSNLVADLENATAASINTIRYAFQVQKWLERANFGSRFFEMLNLHYGVTSPDARLQRPEYLGGFDFYINVDQVVATATSTDGTGTSSVGQTGAVSVTGVKGRNLFHKAFVEPGYVLVLISTTHERSYAQGLLREDLRQDRFDFYFPEFANLGDQLITKKEIYFADDVEANENAAFGYQEHWAEYRYRANRVSGLMNPNVSGALSYWNLAEAFASRPALTNGFIMENRDDLQRCLATGSTGPDYIGDFYLDYTAVREMPLYTIPGLVDHFGTM